MFYTERKSDRYCNVILRELSKMDNVQIIPMDWVSKYPHERVNEGMFWRFNAITTNDDQEIHEFALIRDCDSRLSRRELGAVLNWIDSNKHVHMIRDHPRHWDMAVRGGLWGCRNHTIHIRRHMAVFEPKTTRGADERFLNEHIITRLMAHNFYLSYAQLPNGVERPNDIQSGPLHGHRDDSTEYIGQPFDERDRPIPC